MTIAGLDCHSQRAEVQRHVGDLPDNPAWYDDLRGREILQFVAEMHGLSRADAARRADQALADGGLADATDKYAVNYSLGMKKKLGLACAQLHEPGVLILDEPTRAAPFSCRPTCSTWSSACARASASSIAAGSSPPARRPRCARRARARSRSRTSSCA